MYISHSYDWVGEQDGGLGTREGYLEREIKCQSMRICMCLCPYVQECVCMRVCEREN